MPEDNNATNGNTSSLSRNLIITAVVASLGSNGVSLYGTQDRYYAETANRDFQIRDGRIERLEKDLELAEARLAEIDATHPPPELLKRITTMEVTMFDIILQLSRHDIQVEVK